MTINNAWTLRLFYQSSCISSSIVTSVYSIVANEQKKYIYTYIFTNQLIYFLQIKKYNKFKPEKNERHAVYNWDLSGKYFGISIKQLFFFLQKYTCTLIIFFILVKKKKKLINQDSVIYVGKFHKYRFNIYVNSYFILSLHFNRVVSFYLFFSTISFLIIEFKKYIWFLMTVSYWISDREAGKNGRENATNN